MIIGGSVGTIWGIFLVLGIGVTAVALGDAANMGLLLFGAILWLFGTGISLVAGIIGVKNAAKPEKATVCIVFGLSAALASVLSNILTVVGGGEFNVSGLLTGLLFPILYLIGAIQNKVRSI